MINNIKCLKWQDNSCRYDAILTLYLLMINPYIEKKGKYSYIQKYDLIYKLDTAVSILINDPVNEEIFKLWSFFDTLKFDTGKESLFGEHGYISGLFKIFNNNLDFCLELNKKSTCIICNKETTVTYIHKCLISLNKDEILISNLEKILIINFLLV